LGYPVLDAIGALIVGLMILKMGWRFGWDALHDLMDRAVSVEENRQIADIVCATPGVLGMHDLRTRKMGDMILVDVHLEVDGEASVRTGHDIALDVTRRVKESLPVLSVMTHIDPA
jgi:cation diffusion facilitator family transporter